ncbi:uncharacterized protein LOC132246610 [Alligator mississippiensis]|uniref:uncharacterized protein LOC132246610 n=1 Tax=Alligator mississippiensis TaxID=8496 RepID=UPI00287813D1|nr:uncharacterized protein LOC132246610 [Alligator mississippiensis]
MEVIDLKLPSRGMLIGNLAFKNVVPKPSFWSIISTLLAKTGFLAELNCTKKSASLAVPAASAQKGGLESSPLVAVLGNLSFVARLQGLAPAELLVGGDERELRKSTESFSSISGFSTSDPSAARCLVDQAQGNLGPEFGQADVDLDITVSLLLERLQQEEETRVTIYSSLQEVLQGDIKSLDRDLVRRIIHLASKDMRETQQENDEVQLAAGKTLVALAGTFYNWVMYELQCHVGIMELPPIDFLITLGDLASAYGTALPPLLPGSHQGLWREGINTTLSNGAITTELDLGPKESGSWI